MFISTGFTFDGTHSNIYQVRNIRLSGGMFQQNFSPNRSIIEDAISSKDKPFFYGVENNPFSISMQLIKEGEWTEEDRRSIMQWLIKDEYKLLRADDMDIGFKVIATGQPVFNNNGTNEGYLEMEFRTDSGHGYAPKTTTYKDFLGVSDGDPNRNFNIECLSNTNIKYYPDIKVTLGSAETSFKISNNSNGYSLEFNNLNNGEVLYIDGENGVIISSLGNNRLKDLVDYEFMHLDYGINNITVTGDVKIEFITEYPVIL